jgi:hypothetical protein
MKLKTLLLGLMLLSFSAVRNAAAGDWFFDDRFADELFAPIHHTHFSERGTPFVHPFTIEPPQIHQDAFFIYKYAENTIEGSDEHEAEAHLDWALTKRLGFVFAVPLVGVEESDGTHSVGIGDLEIAPRIMWIERDDFILASNIFITVPTGDDTRDLGAGETVISPFITTWHDLGNWNTLLLNFGPEIGVDSGDTSLIYNFVLTHSFLGPAHLESHSEEHLNEEEDGHGIGDHFPPGMTTLYLETAVETELSGAQRTFVELMPGISYVLTEHAEIRFGVLFGVSRAQRFDRQYFSSFTWIY